LKIDKDGANMVHGKIRNVQKTSKTEPNKLFFGHDKNQLKQLND